MPRTPFATEIHDTAQKSVRIPSAGQPSFIVIHHAATESFRAVVTMELGTKQVSSTVVIKDGQVASMFDEVYRAWSLSSQYWDSVSLSSETCNSGGAAQGWPISEESYATLAKVVADWCVRWGIPCNRERIMGHREVYTRYGASYATACPGGINLDRVVSMAQAIINGTTPTPSKEELEMATLYQLKGNPAVYLVNLDTGLFWHVPSEGELKAVVGNGFSTNQTPKELDQNGWDRLTSIVAAAKGPVTFDKAAEASLVKAIVAALPASSGGTGGTVDYDKITKIVQDNVPKTFALTGTTNAK